MLTAMLIVSPKLRRVRGDLGVRFRSIVARVTIACCSGRDGHISGTQQRSALRTKTGETHSASRSDKRVGSPYAPLSEKGTPSGFCAARTSASCRSRADGSGRTCAGWNPK